MDILSRFLVDRLAVDLGSVNTLFHVPGHGIILNEPSVVAIDKYSNEVLAVGRSAERLLGREPRDIQVHRPIRCGAIDNFETTQQMLKAFIKHVRSNGSLPARLGWPIIRRSHMVIGVPGSSTTIEQRSIRAAARQINSGRVDLLDEGLAAAIGAGLELDDEHARLVVDIGGGTTNIAIVASGGVIYSKSIGIAGNALDNAVREYLRLKYAIHVGERTAESVKRDMGTVHQDVSAAISQTQVIGKQLSNGSARAVDITASEVSGALEPIIVKMTEEIHRVIETADPEVTADLYKYGVILTGGGALLSGLRERLQEELQLNVVTAVEPLTCVARGAGKLIVDRAKFFRAAIRQDITAWDASPDLVVS